MEPGTDQRAAKRRRVSIILTVAIHSVILTIIFLPLLGRMDLIPFGSSNPSNSEFGVSVEQSLFQERQVETPVEKMPVEIWEPEEEEDKPEPDARPLPAEGSRTERAVLTTLQPDTELQEEVAGKQASSEQQARQASQKRTEYLAAFGQDRTDTGAAGTSPGSPIQSLPDGVQVDGLSGRVPVYMPPVKGSITENGTVVVTICINQYGEVIRADYTQSGTTTGTYLKQLAEANACDWKFNEGERSVQCGKIYYAFRLE